MQCPSYVHLMVRNDRWSKKTWATSAAQSRHFVSFSTCAASTLASPSVAWVLTHCKFDGKHGNNIFETLHGDDLFRRRFILHGLQLPFPPLLLQIIWIGLGSVLLLALLVGHLLFTFSPYIVNILHFHHAFSLYDTKHKACTCLVPFPCRGARSVVHGWRHGGICCAVLLSETVAHTLNKIKSQEKQMYRYRILSRKNPKIAFNMFLNISYIVLLFVLQYIWNVTLSEPKTPIPYPICRKINFFPENENEWWIARDQRICCILNLIQFLCCF